MALVPSVAAGQLIDPLWGNAVADALNALGEVDYSAKGTGQATISSIVDLSDMSVTFTADPTRVYKTTMFCRVQQATSLGTSTLTIADGANTALMTGLQSADATYSFHSTIVLRETGLSGSVTRKGRAQTSAGTITVGSASFILVEDIGEA